MPPFAFNKTPEEDKNESMQEAKNKPPFEPKRVIHPAKLPSRSGEGKLRTASIFQSKPASPPEARSQPENAKPEGFPTRINQTFPARSEKSINPGQRLRALVTAGTKPPPIKPQSKPNLFSGHEQTFRTIWDVAAGCSLIVNAILMAMLLIMYPQIAKLKTTVNGLLSGLYGNIVEMDKTSITTTITVDTQVPVNFMLPIQQNTDVILTDSITIPKAHIVINSGGLSINAPTSITIPAGTNLPIALNIAVPVQISVPVTLQVPVKIPLAQTELHQPLTGLQETVREYYCTFDENAQYPQGIYICEDHAIPPSTPGVP